MVTLQELKYMNDIGMANPNMIMSIPSILTINKGYDIPISSDDIGTISYFMVSGNDVIGDEKTIEPMPIQLPDAIPLVMLEYDQSKQTEFMANETYAIKKIITIGDKQYFVAYAKRIQYIPDYNIYYSNGSSINTLTEEDKICIQNDECDGIFGFSHKFKMELNQDELECIEQYGQLVYNSNINVERVALIRATSRNGEISKGIISYIKKNRVFVKDYITERNIYDSTLEIGKVIGVDKVNV